MISMGIVDTIKAFQNSEGLAILPQNPSEPILLTYRRKQMKISDSTIEEVEWHAERRRQEKEKEEAIVKAKRAITDAINESIPLLTVDIEPDSLVVTRIFIKLIDKGLMKV